MPYAVDRVGPAIRGFTNTVKDIGDSAVRSRQDLADFGLEKALVDKKLNDYERYEKPQLEANRQTLLDKQATQNAQFNVLKHFMAPSFVDRYTEKGLPPRTDKVAFLFKNQKNGTKMSPMDSYRDAAMRYGVTIDDSGSAWDKNGKPVPFRVIDQQYPQLRSEWRAMQDIYSDAEKAHMTDLSYMKHLIDNKMGGPEQIAKWQQWYDTNKDVTDAQRLQWSENRASKLAKTIAFDRREGRNTTDLEYNLERELGKIKGIKDAAAKAQEQQFELEKLRVQEAGKDRRAKDKKEGKPTADIQWAKFLSDVKGIPVDEAADMVRSDKSMPERLRLAQEELASYEMDFMGMEPDERQGIVDRILQKYGLDAVPGQKESEQPKQMESQTMGGDDPLGIR